MKKLIRTIVNALVPAWNPRPPSPPTSTSSAPLVLVPGNCKFRATLLGDKSGSIDSSGLVETLCSTFDRTLESIATAAGSLARIVLFNGEVEVHTGRDRNHQGDIDSQFVPAREVAQTSVSRFYRPGGTTFLERYLCREVQVLLRSFEKDRTGEFTHVLFLITDGRDEAPQQYKRAEVIREYMAQVLKHAERCGGVTRSRIVAFYVGIGLTEDEHRETAAKLGFPTEWVHHVPATMEAVRDLGQTVSHTVMGMTEGHTVIGRPRSSRSQSDSGMLATPTP